MCGNTNRGLQKDPELRVSGPNIQYIRSHCTADSQSTTEQFYALESLSLIVYLEVNQRGDGNIYNCSPWRTLGSSPVNYNHSWTLSAHISPRQGSSGMTDWCCPCWAALSQGPRHSNTEDICCVLRPPGCEQAQSFALFPFSSSLSSYQVFSTCCFHHFSCHREFYHVLQFTTAAKVTLDCLHTNL